VDRTIRVWKPDENNPCHYTYVCELEGHEGTVNAIAVADGLDIVASGAADGTVKIWRFNCQDGEPRGQLLNTLPMKPRYFPLTLALRLLDTENPEKPVVLAIAGTTNVVQIYVAQSTISEPEFSLGATLRGHEAWVRSLAFTEDKSSAAGDLLLASASQDKYIRLWRIHRGESAPVASKDEDDPILGGYEPTLSNKAHMFEASRSTYSATFEALLLGHEDWIYTVTWNPHPDRMQLLSASADNSLTIWEPDPVSGVWVSIERMGEISVQKGSTSATGSTGGFWIGLWSPNGRQVVSLARTGSWRVWEYDEDSDIWMQQIGVSGHVRSVNDLQWEPDGGYLLSTSSDQTTRLYAKWIRDESVSWHEFSRPQIHGYDLNCVASLGPARFVSGADEKLLRVFNEPKPIAQLLQNLCGIRQTSQDELPETANIPVLGLSNKAMGEDVALGDEALDGVTNDQLETRPAISLDFSQPPLEDGLARYTLWPEHEKLYGHGYEISAVAVSQDRSLIATACKASSIDHAVIRLYDTTDWHEIKPSLKAHSLTITALCFSADDRYLLSVGRDRQWAVFRRSETEPSNFSLLTSNPKGHSRMILDAAWAPLSQPPTFATAGRDKSVKLWQMTNETFECKSVIPLKSAGTALSFLPMSQDSLCCLAVGEDTGDISIHRITGHNLETHQLLSMDKLTCPLKAITRLSWRPSANSIDVTRRGRIDAGRNESDLLAVASEDSSLRIYAITNLMT
jgi:elongator complex protein 2